MLWPNSMQFIVRYLFESTTWNRQLHNKPSQVLHAIFLRTINRCCEHEATSWIDCGLHFNLHLFAVLCYCLSAKSKRVIRLQDLGHAHGHSRRLHGEHANIRRNVGCIQRHPYFRARAGQNSSQWPKRSPNSCQLLKMAQEGSLIKS